MLSRTSKLLYSRRGLLRDNAENLDERDASLKIVGRVIVGYVTVLLIIHA